MRTASLTAVAALFCAASPAFATSSIHCRTRAGGPEIWLVVPNERGAGVTEARIVDGREEIMAGTAHQRRPWIVSSQVNPRRLRVNIVFGRGERGVLESLFGIRRGVPYVGGFTWRGRTLTARCYWDEDDPG